jgi:predicted esterase
MNGRTRLHASAGAMLLRATTSRRAEGDLAGEPVLIISGQHDPIVPASNSAQLAAVLMNAGATVRGPRAVTDGPVACRVWLKASFARRSFTPCALARSFSKGIPAKAQKDRRRVK